MFLIFNTYSTLIFSRYRDVASFLIWQSSQLKTMKTILVVIFTLIHIATTVWEGISSDKFFVGFYTLKRLCNWDLLYNFENFHAMEYFI